MADVNLQQIEYAVLGTMLQRPACVGTVVADVSADDFGLRSTEGLYQAICALHLRGAPIDPVTVLHEAGSDYEPVVSEAMKHQTDDIGYYCSMLHQCSRLRTIQGVAMDLYAADSLAQAEPLVDKLNRVMVSRNRVDVLTAREAARQFLQDMGSGEKPSYLSWGIRALDDCLLCELGDFVLLGGYASSGKTLLSLQLAAHWARKYRVGYFSLESSNKKLVNRMICHLAQVPLWAVKKREFDRDAAGQLVQAAKILDGLQIEFISANGMNVRDIQAEALSKRFQIVIVDYLQIAAGTGRNRYEEVTSTSIGLHNLAQGNGIMVLALAQLSRPEKSKAGELSPPSLASFRESGQLEQDADIALLLWPEDPNNNRSRRILKVAKNKEGERDRVYLNFNGSTQTFTPDSEPVGRQMRDMGRKAKAQNAAQQNLFRPDLSTGPSPFDKEAEA